MQQRETLQEHIYKDLLMRIYEGEFPIDSALPTLQTLSRQYQTGDKSIRAVIVRLKSEGYLSTTQGRPARVIRQRQETALEEQPLPDVSCDKEELYSFYEVVRIVFPTIFTHVTMNCSASQRKALGRLIPKLPVDHGGCSNYAELNIRFFKGFIAAEKNRLLVHIVQTVMRNTVLPAALVQQQANRLEKEYLESAATMRSIYAAMMEKDAVAVKRNWARLFQIAEIIARKEVESLPDRPARKTGTRAGLQGTDEYKYFLVAYDLYERIMEGEYPVGTMLPTISQAREIYHTASVTIQTAYRVLNGLGVARTKNGRGTEVIGVVAKQDAPLDEVTLRVGTREYLEAIEFLGIVCEEIVCLAQEGSIQTLSEKLEGRMNPEHQHSALVLCRYIMKGSNSPAIESFYQIISRQLSWGGYLRRARGVFSPEEEHCRCQAIVDALKRGRTKLAVDLTKELIATLAASI